MPIRQGRLAAEFSSPGVNKIIAVTRQPPAFFTTSPHADCEKERRHRFRYGSVGIGGCGDSQPPIPTFADRGRLRWTVPASRTLLSVEKYQ